MSHGNRGFWLHQQCFGIGQGEEDWLVFKGTQAISEWLLVLIPDTRSVTHYSQYYFDNKAFYYWIVPERKNFLHAMGCTIFLPTILICKTIPFSK